MDNYRRLLIIVLTVSSIFYAFRSPDDFVVVLNRVENQNLSQKLFEFQSQGIELKVAESDYDIEEVIKYAKSFLGTRHKMGGTSRKGIDCSGLVMVVHEKFNVILPRSASDQARYGEVISDMEDLERGDLVFFCQSYNTSKPITHSGIYLGDDKFIHTSSSEGVVISSLIGNSYWKEKFLFGTRLYSK